MIDTTSQWPMWTPGATVTVKDLTGALVSGATANFTFDADYSSTCVAAP
ncbi:MAG: hypothetical protein L0H96_08010 [Humibacillus sp.]|nr:hypothetical protein [Humibacillus sp.]MDN5776838.1 hypothetical protein [Humibacillus sp.]